MARQLQSNWGQPGWLRHVFWKTRRLRNRMRYSRKALTPNNLSCLALAFSLLCAPISTFASQQTDRAILNKGKQSSDVYISRYTRDLTEAAKHGILEPVNGYTSEINQLVQI